MHPRVRPLAISAAALAAAFTLGASACAKGDETPPPPRTPEQQRAVDSTIGASSLPGAGGVRNALAASDSAAKRRALADSLARNP
jgi:hypothetical protein